MRRIQRIQIVTVLAARAIFAQDAAPLRFEVVSVKIAAPSAGPEELGARKGVPGTESPEHISWRAIPVGQLMRAAYAVNRRQIAGPDWLFRYSFSTIVDIQANVAPGTTWDQVDTMTRTLLEERFGLKVHREEQERVVYVLTAKPGAKIGGGEGLNSVESRMSQAGAFAGPKDGGILLAGGKMTTAELAETLEFYLDEPELIVDRTGSTGTYEFVLHFSNGQRGTDDPKWPTLFRALEEVGLKLEKKKEPVEMLIVDRIEKAPTAN